MCWLVDFTAYLREVFIFGKFILMTCNLVAKSEQLSDFVHFSLNETSKAYSTLSNEYITFGFIKLGQYIFNSLVKKNFAIQVTFY